VNRAEPAAISANERLKSGEGTRLWSSLVVATVLHALLFQLWPDMYAQVPQDAGEAAQVLALPPDVQIPEAPQPLARPLRPVASADVPIDAVPPVVAWTDVPDLPPPPPKPAGGEPGRVRPFTPYTVAPSLANRGEMHRALEREYPPSLRDAGIGGTVALLLHIDEQGRLLEAEVGTSSGFAALDQAALRVAHVMRFRAALNRDKKVAVWVVVPVTFRPL
jgi:protein TonB